MFKPDPKRSYDFDAGKRYLRCLRVEYAGPMDKL
jgi:hypothetical protein